jgi:hypothetical protein
MTVLVLPSTMSSSREQNGVLRMTEVHVGPTPRDFLDTTAKRTTVHFHDFVGLLGNRNRIPSHTFSCLGHEWRLGIRLEDSAQAVDDIDVPVCLYHCSDDPITVSWSIVVRKFSRVAHLGVREKDKFKQNEGSSFHALSRVRNALGYLENDTLTFEVLLKPHEPPRGLPFIPENPMACKFVQGLFMNEESADVVIEVKGRDQQSNNEDTVLSTKFFAHSLVLKSAAPLLAELCMSNNTTSSTVFEVPDITPGTFKKMLMHIYGFAIPDLGSDTLQTMDIIDAADKFGVTTLKLEAEASYVKSLNITLYNVMDHFQYADSKNCALLKEVIMDFIVKNKAEVMENKILLNCTVDLSNDILAAMMRGEKVGKASAGSGNGGGGLAAMGISELRQKAFEKGLEVDGSREMLISALESHKRKRTSTEE